MRINEWVAAIRDPGSVPNTPFPQRGTNMTPGRRCARLNLEFLEGREVRLVSP
jgi:hypothetical protein